MTREDEDRGVARRARWPWVDALAWLGVVGAVLTTYAIILPWARFQVTTTAPGQGPSTSSWYPMTTRIALDFLLSARFGAQSYSLARDISFLWIVTLSSGVVLALAMAIWRRSKLAGAAYLVWLVVVTMGFTVIVYSVFGPLPQDLPCMNCAFTVITARAPSAGFWLNAGALALAWVGGGARLANLRRTSSVGISRLSLASALRSLVSPARIGALGYSAGVAVWFFGYIFTPWATQGCAGFPVNWSHFVSGSCAGLDSDEILVYSTSSGFGNGSYLGFWVIGVLLTMLVALIAIWQRGWIPLLISLLWAAFAFWLTALAISGFPGVFQHPQVLHYSTAPWVVGYGPAVSVAGLVIAWFGIAALGWRWLADWRASPRRLIRDASARLN